MSIYFKNDFRKHLTSKKWQDTVTRLKPRNAELKQRHGLDVARASGLFSMELQAATIIFVVNMKRIMTLIDQKEE